MNKIAARLISEIPTILIMLLLGGILVVGMRLDQAPVETAKVYCFENGVKDTGAINLVTAIYLGYRAFDTLGETIVLVVSIAGVIFLLELPHA